MSPAPMDGRTRAALDKLPEGDLALLQDFRRDLAQKKSEMVRLRRIAGSGRLTPFGKRVAEDRIRVVEESIRRLEGLVKKLARGAGPAGGGALRARCAAIERTLAEWRGRGIDTTDLELELKLAKHNLEAGRLRMAEVYLESLRLSMRNYEGRGVSRRRTRKKGASGR